jgi:hypothetical protein
VPSFCDRQPLSAELRPRHFALLLFGRDVQPSPKLASVSAAVEASHDAEAWDRPSASLAPADLELIAAVRATGKPFVVVLVGGGAVDVSGLGANALLMGWLGGQGFGGAPRAGRSWTSSSSGCAARRCRKRRRTISWRPSFATCLQEAQELLRGAMTDEILHQLLFLVNGDMDPAAVTALLRQHAPAGGE